MIVTVFIIVILITVPMIHLTIFLYLSPDVVKSVLVIELVR